MIKLEEHKVYIDSHKMEMVPYSIAIQALEEVSNIETEKYLKDLEHATSELHQALSQLNTGY
jgi:hypothetical protein